MLKQIAAMIILSIIIVFSMSYLQFGLQYLVDFHEWIDQLLTEIFSPAQSGLLLKNLIALLAVPLLIGLVSAFFYWLIKRNWPPFFMEVIWVVWLLQAGALVMLYQG